MTSVPHEPVTYGSGRPQWAEFLRIPEMWAIVVALFPFLGTMSVARYGFRQDEQ
jgi:hypothetical protein